MISSLYEIDLIKQYILYLNLDGCWTAVGTTFSLFFFLFFKFFYCLNLFDASRCGVVGNPSNQTGTIIQSVKLQIHRFVIRKHDIPYVTNVTKEIIWLDLKAHEIKYRLSPSSRCRKDDGNGSAYDSSVRTFFVEDSTGITVHSSLLKN